ncbi:MAG: hypothetical protein L6R38_000927 [Xanthoria sp. 2 TBL-2021]|nr:MAG: hypothetical protein L6R38_000927 [Xanthoria sp. 2 TBL-2021]
MPESHPMVLELCHQPLDPQLQLEHELRIIAIEGWYKQRGKTQPLVSREEEEKNETSNEKDDGFERQWNMDRQQRQQEELEEAEHEDWKSARWAELRRGLVTGGGSGHVVGGKVVKPSSVPGPRPLLGQGSVKDGPAGYGAMGGGGLLGSLNGGDEQAVREEGMGWGEGASAGSRPLLGQVPAMATQGAGHEADGEVFDAGPWEEIGRQWARIRPWELH